MATGPQGHRHCRERVHTKRAVIRYGPAADHGGEGDGAALGVAPVCDKLEGALGDVEGGAGEGEGTGGGGDGGEGSGGDGGSEVELGGGDGGLGVLDATLVLGDVLGEGMGEEVVAVFTLGNASMTLSLRFSDKENPS